MKTFEAWMVEEGETWEAIKKGVTAGLKVFKQAKVEAKAKQLPDNLMAAIISAKTKDEIKAIAEKMVDNGLVFKAGTIRPATEPCLTKWLSENVQTQERHEIEEAPPTRSWKPLDIKGGKLVGNPYYSYPKRRRSNSLV